MENSSTAGVSKHEAAVLEALERPPDIPFADDRASVKKATEETKWMGFLKDQIRMEKFRTYFPGAFQVAEVFYCCWWVNWYWWWWLESVHQHFRPRFGVSTCLNIGQLVKLCGALGWLQLRVSVRVQYSIVVMISSYYSSGLGFLGSVHLRTQQK